MIFRNTYLGFKSALKNLWRNRMMSIASITSVIATLMILGLIFIVILNINNAIESAQRNYKQIIVFLEDELGVNDIANLKTDIASINGVNGVVFVSKEKALNDWRVKWGENAYLLDGLDSNPLPNSFVIDIQSLDNADSIVKILSEFGGIEKVRHDSGTIETILNVSRIVRTAGLTIIVILIAITTFIIGNTIKLAVNSRRSEINIMKYVGATNWYIRRPFLIEGTILGFIGGLVASGLVYAIYDSVYNYFSDSVMTFVSTNLVATSVIMNDLFTIFIVLGVGIGVLGSINAMRRHLNV